MALEFICSDKIEFQKKIIIPRGAECYRLKSGKIKFFRNSNNGFGRIPFNADYVSFDIERNSFNINYGNPDFYDINEKLLNSGNK